MSKWKVFENEKPKENDHCFVFVDDNHDHFGIYRGCFTTATFCFQQFYSNCEDITKKVRFWMKIPELPS